MEPLRFVSAKELVAEYDKEVAQRSVKDAKWGPWHLNRERLSLTGPYNYEIDLEMCRNSNAILDWIAQLAGKEWVTDQMLGQLVRAFDDLFHLQANYCSHGMHKEKGKEPNPIDVLRAEGWIK